MSKNVFISFRYRDGKDYKKDLSDLFDTNEDTVDYSEDIDRSNLTDATIKDYLYSKLRRSSITIILLTPAAINHEKNWCGRYDDWMYDEIRYSLEDREGNRTNGLIAVYTPEAKNLLMHIDPSTGNSIVHRVDNLFRENMMNVKPKYKKNPKDGVYDTNYDSYCSLVSLEQFKNNVEKYINIATEKRENLYKYDITRQLR